MTARLPDMWPGLMRRIPQSAHCTHVQMGSIEIEAHYDYSQEVVVLEHAYVTDGIACGPDLADWLHSSQREQIEQAILIQLEQHA